MTNPQFHTHQGVRLAFRHQPGAGPLIVFLPGYMSDMQGSKAEALAAWATANARALLRLDYSGCGESEGEFLHGSISRWAADALALIDHVAPGAPVLLIGSSMGGWIGLRLGLALGPRLVGFIGIAAAPDFTDWGLGITPEDTALLASQGWFNRPSGYDAAGYRYSAAFIADAATARLLAGPIAITAPVRLLHGQQDDAVPWQLSLEIAEKLHSADVQVTLVKDGDHRLSREADIALLIALTARLAEQVAP